MRVLTLVATLAFLGCVSCVELPTQEPLSNVYQPENVLVGCSDLEYKWSTVDGTEHRAFYPGQGGFCAHIERDQTMPLQARCVVLDDDRNIIEESRWVNAVPADNAGEFRKLCPN